MRKKAVNNELGISRAIVDHLSNHHAPKTINDHLFTASTCSAVNSTCPVGSAPSLRFEPSDLDDSDDLGVGTSPLPRFRFSFSQFRLSVMVDSSSGRSIVSLSFTDLIPRMISSDVKEAN